MTQIKETKPLMETYSPECGCVVYFSGTRCSIEVCKEHDKGKWGNFSAGRKAVLRAAKAAWAEKHGSPWK